MRGLSVTVEIPGGETSPEPEPTHAPAPSPEPSPSPSQTTSPSPVPEAVSAPGAPPDPGEPTAPDASVPGTTILQPRDPGRQRHPRAASATSVAAHGPVGRGGGAVHDRGRRPGTVRGTPRGLPSRRGGRARGSLAGSCARSEARIRPRGPVVLRRLRPIRTRPAPASGTTAPSAMPLAIRPPLAASSSSAGAPSTSPSTSIRCSDRCFSRRARWPLSHERPRPEHHFTGH